MRRRASFGIAASAAVLLVYGCPAEPTRTPAADSGSLPPGKSPDAARPDAHLADHHIGGPTPVNVPPAPPFDSAGCTQPPVTSECTNGFCRIPAGCFVMGSPETEWYRGSVAERRTAVTLTRSFEIQAHEVTQREWLAAGLPNPSGRMADGTGDCTDPDCPVGNVTWTEAVAYANLLSQHHSPALAPCYELSACQKSLGAGLVCGGFKTTAATVYDCEGYRLPTQAEWEYAARAGSKTAFYDGDITQYEKLDCYADPALEKIAWYCHNSGGSTHPVGMLRPNAFGLFDTAGNAEEWTNDHNTGLPADVPVDPGAVLRIEAPRIVRGGLFNGLSPACRAAASGIASFFDHGPGLGFRVVRTLQ
jgi:sulfatase modifying factor 1